MEAACFYILYNDYIIRTVGGVVVLKKGCQCGWLPESFPVQMFMYAWLLKSDSHRRKCMPFMYAEEIVQSSAAAACQMENSRSG